MLGSRGCGDSERGAIVGHLGVTLNSLEVQDVQRYGFLCAERGDLLRLQHAAFLCRRAAGTVQVEAYLRRRGKVEYADARFAAPLEWRKPARVVVEFTGDAWRLSPDCDQVVLAVVWYGRAGEVVTEDVAYFDLYVADARAR